MQQPENYYARLTTLHPFNGPFSGTTRVSRYQKGRTDLDFTEARDSEWLWHQLGHMQVCTSLQTDDHASTHHSVFFTGRMPFLPPNQQCQSTEGPEQPENSNQKYAHIHTHTPVLKALYIYSFIHQNVHWQRT